MGYQDLVAFPKRDLKAHKYTAGALGLLVGSETYPGAAILACQAAFRSGAGLVFVFSSPAIKEMLIKACPDVIFCALDYDSEGMLTPKAFHQLCDGIERYKLKLLAIGSGLAKQDASILLEGICYCLDNSAIPILLDADALQASLGPFLRQDVRAKRILITPHLGEFNRVFQERVSEENRYQALQTGEFRCSILLKGAPTYVYARKSCWQNPTGNAALAVAGTGDVLLGMIAAFVLQGLSLEDGAKWGAYVHGQIADCYVKKEAIQSFRATDLIEALPLVLKDCIEKVR